MGVTVTGTDRSTTQCLDYSTQFSSSYQSSSANASGTISAIGGSFDYMKRRLGLDEADSEALGSPFDYARAALLYVPNDLPDPNQAGYQTLMERTILDVVTRLHWRTLVLFTSRAHLRATYQALREPLAGQGRP